MYCAVFETVFIVAGVCALMLVLIVSFVIYVYR